ncbi:MAG: hypothetical protein R2824_03365 [Saprospiraceae bacterium]|nr:hypothetical protein [Lewinella sp.]
MKPIQNLIASAGLAIGAVFGIAGSIFSAPITQIVLYEISSIGLTAGCALLAVKFIRDSKDYLATGFLLLAIAEAVMSSASSLGQVGGQPSFGAGMALYVPAFLFISMPKNFPIWARIANLAACVPFGIAAATIFFGGEVPSTSALPGAGYGLLVVSIIGWILTLLKERSS